MVMEKRGREQSIMREEWRVGENEAEMNNTVRKAGSRGRAVWIRKDGSIM